MSMAKDPPRTAVAQTARSRRTRVALVDAVHQELRSTGGFNADAVAARAGCSAATFYSHFGSKDAALTAAFELVLAELLQRSATLLSIHAIRRHGVEKAVVQWVESQAEFFRAENLVFRAALAQLPHDRALRVAYRDAETSTLARLTEVIRTGQAEHLIRPGDAQVIAEAVTVMGQGVNNPRLLRPAAAPVRAEVAAAISAVLEPTRRKP